MSGSADGLEGTDVGRLEGLVKSWNSEASFDDWVRSVSDSYLASHQRLEGAAKLLGTTPVELQAVLNLATLDDEDLALLGDPIPPKTTWLALATASRPAIETALAALHRMPHGASPSRTVDEAIQEIDGPDQADRIAGLSGATIVHMAKKAKQYGLLGDRGTKALEDLGSQKRTGRALTGAQVGYLTRLLAKLADGGAIRRDSPDGDQQHCDSVLDALGL